MLRSKSQELSVVIPQDNDTICWGCGLSILIPPSATVFKCGWCGAVTKEVACVAESQGYRCRRIRDQFFVCVIIIFICFFVGGGVWAAHPIVFSTGSLFGPCHYIITIILSITTIVTFIHAAFRSPGKPPNIPWGSYPLVGKGGLENYTFCYYCEKPKSPRTHHCRTCKMCILDMDHHCPFIGNCVGAANHCSFIAFLISTLTSSLYVTIMSAYAVSHIWPPMVLTSLGHLGGLNDSYMAFGIVKEIAFIVLSSAVQLSYRGILLVYLFMSSISIEIAITVLLWQQLCYIYEGKTYLSHLKSDGNDEVEERDCQNLIRFFGCPYSASKLLPRIGSAKKTHDK